MTLNQLIKDATEISHKYTTGDIPLVIYGTEVDIVLTEQGDNGKYHIEVNCVPTPKEKSTLPGDSPLADIMTQQEIEAWALELYPERKRQNKNGTGEYDANLPRRKAYIKGRTDAQPTGEERQQVIDIIRRCMQNRIAAIVNPELVRELTITPAEAELLKKYAVEIPHVEILPPDFDELKNIQMDGSALKINIQFKIKPQNPKEL